MSGYTKLSRALVLSTVWREPNHVRIVWVTMLALADADGYVGASLPGLADAARVSLEECIEALECFKRPDPYSRSKAHEGRRIEDSAGGWTLLNYPDYRAGRDPEGRRRQNREAQARHRGRKPPSATVSHGQPESAAVSTESAQAEAACASASASDLSEGGVGETLSPGELRRPMTAAWQPESETLAAFDVGMIPDWAVAQLVARFRAHFAANKQDLATDVEWNQRCSKWVFRDWGNPSKRPAKPKAEAESKDAEGWA